MPYDEITSLLPAEDQLLYLCALPQLRSPDLNLGYEYGSSRGLSPGYGYGRRGVDPETLRELAASIEDWGDLLEKAFFHRLPIWLYSFLKRNGAVSFLEPEIWNKIEAASRGAQAYVMAHEAELATVLLPRFKEAGISVLLLKGLALLQTVYRENPVRYSVDMDLLIQPSDLSMAREVLQKLGYQAAPLTHFPSRWHEREIGNVFGRQFAFSHPERGIQLDLHIELFEDPFPFCFSSGRLWEKASPISLEGSPAFLPPPLPHFIYLLLHLAKHAAGGKLCFGWFLDLDECLRYFGENLKGEGLEESLHFQPTNKILEVLAFLESHFDSPLPEALQSMIREKRANPLSLEEIFAPPASEWALFNDPTWGDHREEFLFYLKSVRGVRKKIALLGRRIFPDAEYLKTKYPFRDVRGYLKAWIRHWTAIGIKGWGLGFYLLRKVAAKRKSLLTHPSSLNSS